MMALLSAAIVLGLASSLHCAAMCGPLMLLVRRQTWLHHVGRIGTYVALGLAAGLAGRVVAGAGYARLLSVVAGVGLLAAAIGPRVSRARRSGRRSRLVDAFSVIASWRSRHGRTGALAFGVLNGLLPCGLVYGAAGAAVTAGDAYAGATFMAAFGVATVPALLAAQWITGIARGARARRLRYAMPVALALTGALLVARGVVPSPPASGHAAHAGMQITSSGFHVHEE